MADRSELWDEREGDELMLWDSKIYLGSRNEKIVRQAAGTRSSAERLSDW